MNTCKNPPHDNHLHIAFHQYDGKGSIGCLTTLSGSSKTLILELQDAIPDLFIHTQMEKADIIIKRRHIRVILEEREVDEETWEDTAHGTTRWRGKISK